MPSADYVALVTVNAVAVVSDWHKDIATAKAVHSANSVRRLSEPAAAQVILQSEPSGEIRARVVLPSRSARSAKSALADGPQAAGCRALVYSAELGELQKHPGGAGSLPRDSQLSRGGKRAIRNAVGLLEQKYGKRIVFGTVTLPGSTDTASRAVAIWSAKIVELLRKKIEYSAQGAEWVYVWEWQTRGALHLHIAIAHLDIYKLRRLEREWHGYVYKLWQTVSRLSGVDVFGRRGGGTWVGMAGALRANCEPVRKSVKRYMAKYLSKGNSRQRVDRATGEVSTEVAGVQACSPSRWWGQSRSLARAVKDSTSCIVLRSEDWDLAVLTFQDIEAEVGGLGLISYGFGALFAPYNLTRIIYPPENSQNAVYDYLTRILQRSYIRKSVA